MEKTVNGNLRMQVLQGGTYLVLRRGSAILLNLLNIVVLTKILGVGGYGLYTAAIIIYGYISNLSQLGVGVYLIRQESVTSDDYHQTFTLCAVLSVVGLVCGGAAIPFVARLSEIDGLTWVLFSMLAALPLTLTTAVPSAILERGLKYKPLTIADLFGQIVFSVVGLSLVWFGFGIWGVIVGWWLQQITTAVWLYKNSEYVPRLRWNLEKFRAMLAYGFSFSLSIWIWQARDLVNPLLVGHFAGAEGVGIVALTIRIAQALSFIKDATWRLSIAAFAQIQNDRAKLLTAVREGMFLQTLSLGPILVVFNWLAPWILPLFFGGETVQVLNLYPFIALSFLVNAAFNMHSAALYVRQHNRSVAIFHLAHIIIFFGATILLVPQIGIAGYGLAELAAMPAYVLIYLSVRRRVGAFGLSQAALMLVVFALALFTKYLGWLAALALLILPFNQNVRRDAMKIFKVVFAQLDFKRFLKFATG